MALREEISIGITQLRAGPDKWENIEKFKNLVLGNVREVDVIVTPEYFMTVPDYFENNPDRLLRVAESLQEDFTYKMSKIAEELSAYILFTMIEKQGTNLFNTAVLLDYRGNIVTVYRKVHLFDAYGRQESKIFKPGNKLSEIVRIENCNIAIAMCFDIRFPEMFRCYALSGCDVVLLPAAWYRGDGKEELLHVLARARAHENGMYVVVANQYSELFTGRSLVASPEGIVIADLGYGEKYVEVKLNLSIVKEMREKVPTLRLRRPRLYTRLLVE